MKLVSGLVGKIVLLVIISFVLGVFGSQAIRAEVIADGVRLVPLTDDGKSVAARWAPHGDKILFVVRHTATQQQLFIANSDGTQAQAISPIGYPYYAQWSWAGDKIAYLFANGSSEDSQAQATIYDLATGETLTACPPYPRFNLDPDDGPVWSPDDRYVSFKTRRGPSRTRFVTVYDTQLRNDHDVLPSRGENRDAAWSLVEPARLAFRALSSGESYDIGVCDPDGGNLKLLTAVGAESIGIGAPTWRPPSNHEELVAFTSNQDMTRTERGLKRNDVWVGRPDGTGLRNFTQASSPSTEEQLNTDILRWSWNGRWLLSRGDRFDAQGKDIHTVYLVDPVAGGYRTIFTTFPQKDGRCERIHAIQWSYDSTSLLLYTQRYVVKNWDTDREYQQTHHVLSLLNMATGQRHELLNYDEAHDLKEILGEDDREEIEDISFAPNGRSILLTIASIISRQDNITRPDVYRLDLPENLISPQAARFDGPPVGRKTNVNMVFEDTTNSEGNRPDVSTNTLAPTPVLPTAGEQIVAEVIMPQHMTVEEVLNLLPAQYSQLLTEDASRNILFYEGPASLLPILKAILQEIDLPSPQILVDLLAVELSEEANRSLGLDWTYAEGHGGIFNTLGGPAYNLTGDATLGPLATDAGPAQFFYSGVGNLPSSFYLRLNALVQEGEGTILANPRTVATAGQESMIQIRKVLNYFFNEGFDVAGRPVVKKSDISADTEGRITPTLLADGRIRMQVSVKVGSFTFSSDSSLPEQTQRESKTVVTVQEDETLVIGGLRQQEMTKVKTKVPVLGDIPLLGALFRKQESKVRHTVLTLFITPHVLRDGIVEPNWPQVTDEQKEFHPIMKDRKTLKP
jgi:Tol biopolymer transport system component